MKGQGVIHKEIYSSIDCNECSYFLNFKVVLDLQNNNEIVQNSLYIPHSISLK